MKKLFCVMGKSASGKDTIYKRIVSDPELSLHTVVPYTTRPIREGEQEGVEYHFVDENGYQALKDGGRIIEERAYHTVHGLWRYFTADDGQVDLNAHHFVMIGTLEAYAQIRAHFGADNIVPVYIQVEEGLRLSRALSREQCQAQPKYAEMCRRFLADCEDFSEDKIYQCSIERRYDNIDIDECFAAVKQDLLRIMNEG